ncbi:Gfo/Idh/MocA family oxidoreductase [Microbacterium sp. B2969]|uniref:Gfo/Idh/MocA family oxidoreductase n=1 Tax=Microbacterium alkaliflavum TaxID=3248839 RepID=A0ABW7QAG0_9MICO
MVVRIGLVGYGVGGRLFHAPYITASKECELVAIVARSDKAVAAARADHPDATIAPSLTALLDAGIVDAVVISTPPETRRDLVLEAIDRGVAVVADKPFAPSGDEAQLLADHTRERGVLLNVFHNRRFDTDIVTARRVLASGRLGVVRGLDLRMDQDDPSTLEGGPTGGLLRDLGSHVIDQTLLLMGPARSVSAHLRRAETPQGPTDAGFSIGIEHESGACSRVSASKIDHLLSKELRLYGESGSYVSDYTDVQFDALRRGIRPADDRGSWGYEEPGRWGMLRTADGVEAVPSSQGDYTRYYDEFADAVASGGRGPVPAEEGIAVLRVLDAVAASDREHRTIAL